MDEFSYDSKWEREEFYRAMRRSHRFTVSYLRAIFGAALIGFALYGSNGHVIILIIAVPVGVILIEFVHLVIKPARIWKADPDRGDTRRNTFSDSGLTTVSKSGTLNIPWSTYGGTRETKNYYFLDMKVGPFATVVRKTSFKTPEDEALFRAILRRNSRAKFKSNLALDGLLD